ncbi:hypothetical protein SASPL_116848 [Salvia splendens]|uniref:S-acyltransferase n=1 Tax=Salvia splendens TaxID=180675 RepID=A0A8X8XWU5_SALSN|nr:hypothetical protein SASPL_116848 [Salvia splendens]
MLKRLAGSGSGARKGRRSIRLAMDLNPFRLCSGLKFLGYFMVGLVLGLIAVSYYAVVILTLGPDLLHGGFTSLFSILLVAIFHVLLVLLAWSYLMAVFRDPGAVPPNWKLLPQQDAAETSSSVELNATAIPQFCNRCQNGKPPRCHHCSVCERCVLKMDHHCIWVVNCVGARNYKFFLLFLIPSLIAVLNLAFVLSLLCFVVMHISLLLSNTTSVEVHEKKKGMPWKYDLGWRKNIEQVFGTRKVLWLFPVFSKEDLERVPALQGLDYPTRPDIINCERESEQNISGKGCELKVSENHMAVNDL